MPVRRRTASADLDLVPVMNLIAILVPFLLSGTQLVGLAVLDTASRAWRTTEPTADGGDGERVWRVEMTPDGLAVVEDGGSELIPCDGPCLAGGWDADRLFARLRARASAGDVRRTVLLRPAPWVDYADVIAVMDALGPSRPGGFARVVLSVEPQAEAP